MGLHHQPARRRDKPILIKPWSHQPGTQCPQPLSIETEVFCILPPTYCVAFIAIYCLEMPMVDHPTLTRLTATPVEARGGVFNHIIPHLQQLAPCAVRLLQTYCDYRTVLCRSLLGFCGTAPVLGSMLTYCRSTRRLS